jgi:Fe-S cluster biosynthesis and repair protein YggX
MAQVTCVRCGKVAEALDEPPLLGARGQTVQDKICANCWSEWVEQSKNVINHYGIQVADPTQRRQLYAVMAEFLKLDTL